MVLSSESGPEVWANHLPATAIDARGGWIRLPPAAVFGMRLIAQGHNAKSVEMYLDDDGLHFTTAP